MKQTGTDCERFERILYAEDEGTEVPERDQTFVRAHAAVCVDCATLTAASDVLGDSSAADLSPQDELARRRYLDRLIEREAQGKPVLPARVSRRGAWIAVAAAVLAAGALVVALWPDGETPQQEQSLAGAEPEISGPRVIAATEDARAHHTRLAAGDRLRQGQTLSAGKGRVVAQISPAVTVELRAGGELELTSVRGPNLTLWLARGSLLSRLKPLDSGQRYVVATRFGEVEARGTAFETQADSDGARVRVLEGSVSVRARGRDEQVVKAGQHAVLGTTPDSAATASAAGTGSPRKTVAAASDLPEPPAAAEPEPQGLLDSAREARLQRRWKAAASDYRRLVSQFPDHAASDTARVALGELLLDRLEDAAGSLTLFEQYLERHPDGALALEARFGKARALRVTGQSALERAALQDFLERFPKSMQAGLADQRLRELGVQP